MNIHVWLTWNHDEPQSFTLLLECTDLPFTRKVYTHSQSFNLS